MQTSELLKNLALVASILLPFFNIPLIVRMVGRKSSDDLSLVWLYGVYVCFLTMLPHGLLSNDVVLFAFSIANVTFFTGVVAVATFYRIKK